MRISADSKHRDYSPASLHAKVYLDGVELRNCVTADEELGTAECFRMDSTGRLVANSCGDAEMETLRGQVRFDLSSCTLPLEFIGFDAWMRARTDAAHNEYMAHNAKGATIYN